MKKIALLITAIFIGINVFSQSCQSYFATEKGTFIEMKSYNEKGKLSGTTRQTITDVSTIPDGMIISVSSEQLDDKNKSLGVTDLKMRCENGVFYLDMKNFINQNAIAKDAEVKIDANDLEFPSSMDVGETLPDGTINMSFVGVPIPMNMSVRIFNRKIEALESITTPAGTFECYKMTSNMETKMGMKMNTSAIQWYAKNIGAIRTETYDKNGKMLGYSELTSFHK